MPFAPSSVFAPWKNMERRLRVNELKWRNIPLAALEHNRRSCSMTQSSSAKTCCPVASLVKAQMQHTPGKLKGNLIQANLVGKVRARLDRLKHAHFAGCCTWCHPWWRFEGRGWRWFRSHLVPSSCINLHHGSISGHAQWQVYTITSCLQKRAGQTTAAQKVPCSIGCARRIT